MSTTTSDTSQAIFVKPKSLVDPGKESGEPLRPQCTRIDFTPTVRDTEETAIRCNQLWEMVKSRPELQGIMVTPEKTSRHKINESVPVHKKPPPPSSGDSNYPEYPAIETLKQIKHKDVVQTALQ